MNRKQMRRDALNKKYSKNKDKREAEREQEQEPCIACGQFRDQARGPIKTFCKCDRRKKLVGAHWVEEKMVDGEKVPGEWVGGWWKDVWCRSYQRYHFHCLTSWITANVETECRWCHQRYQDPRIQYNLDDSRPLGFMMSNPWTGDPGRITLAQIKKRTIWGIVILFVVLLLFGIPGRITTWVLAHSTSPHIWDHHGKIHIGFGSVILLFMALIGWGFVKLNGGEPDQTVLFAAHSFEGEYYPIKEINITRLKRIQQENEIWMQGVAAQKGLPMVDDHGIPIEE